MRFNKIRIPAFGPFTGLEIALPKEGGDFHLFHGPNEAGKSSLLRSLRALLFGIHPQTQDDFLHDFTQMRIGAELEKSDGTTRFFQRRKGNKNTLLDSQAAAIPEGELGGFLGGVDESYFDSMFGLGSTELRQGADSLLRGEGRLGEALFSASLGGTPVDKVIASLEKEAGELFRGRAGSRIRQGKKELDDHKKASKDSIIKVAEWEEVQAAIAQLTGKRAKLLAERQSLASRKSWLERCLDALPVVSQLRESQRQQAQLPSMPDLSERFGEEIRESRRTWFAARDRIEPLKNQLAALLAKAKACELAPEVLALQSEIEALHAGAGVFRAQKQSLADKQAESELRRLQIEATCQELEISTPLAKLESHRISQVKFVEAQRKAVNLTTAKTELKSAATSVQTLEKEIEGLKKQHTAATTNDITAIEQVIARTKGLEETACGLEGRTYAVGALRRQMEDLRSQLSGCQSELEQIPALEVLLNATIERFRDDFDELTRKEKDLETRQSEERLKADNAQTEMDRFSRQRELPSLEDLTVARHHRERGWDLVLKEWKGEAADEELVEGVPLEEAYPKAVAAADSVADRLRTDAEAVAQMEEKRVQLALAENTLTALRAKMKHLTSDRAALQTKWVKAWKAAGVDPLPPREMFEWRVKWEDLRRAWTQWSSDTDKLANDEYAVRNAVSDLAKTLAIQEGSLPSLLTEARERVAKYNQSVGAERAVRTQISKREKELLIIRDALPLLQRGRDDALSAWEAFLTQFSLPESLPAEDSIELLRSRRAMFIEYDQWQALSQTCLDLSANIFTYESEVARLTGFLKMESHGAGKDEAILWKSLERARAAQTMHGELQRRIQETEENLSETGHQLTQSKAALDAMLHVASIPDEGKMDAFLNHFEEKRRLDGRLQTLRDSLAGAARGDTIEAFIEAVEKENELEDSLAAIDGKLTELDSGIEAIRNELQEFTNKQKEMEKASDKSASEAQLAELASSRIEQDSERFVRLRLGITLLKSRIDRFREQNQGPFMEKASRWFAEITGSAFSGITTSYDDGDRPVIAGQRSGDSSGRTVPIGGMSEGTRDQLYLALRLAGLELHLADHEPMPLILDDLLVHFDDERTLRALAALRDFGQHSQVLLFTHHAHLVALAESQWGKDGFHIHPLSRGKCFSGK